MLHSYDQLYKHICMQNHNDDTRRATQFFRKIHLSLYFKGLCVRGSWRLNRTATYWPPLITSVSFSFSWAAQPEGWGPTLLGVGFSLPHLITNWLNFLCTFLWASQVALIQPVHGQGFILIFLDRMHLLFTQVHFLFWLPGWVRGQYTTYVICKRNSSLIASFLNKPMLICLSGFKYCYPTSKVLRKHSQMISNIHI